MRLRRFQYSLRTLFLITTILAVVLSLLRWIYVERGLEVLGIVVAVAAEAILYFGCVFWLIFDADKRIKPGGWRLLLVALFTYFGPFAAIPWFLFRPRIKTEPPSFNSPC
jgi:hypothetical protein